MVKKIAVYGNFKVKVHVKQRYEKWCYHREGKLEGQKWYKRKVWKKTKAMKKGEVIGTGRFEFYGENLYKAIVLAHKFMPKGYQDVSTEEFLKFPEEYGDEGEWTKEKTIEYF